MIISGTSHFSPEVIEYMLLNGYKLLPIETELGILTFTRGEIAVIFWNDKIERRIINADKGVVWRRLKSFKGFDGKDIFKLMLILHVLDAVDLKDVKKRVSEESGKLFKEIIDDVLSTVAV